MYSQPTLRPFFALASLLVVLSGCTCGGAAVGCKAPNDCVGSKPYCATALDSCVQCLQDSHCAGGEICNAYGICEAGCRNDTDRCSLGQVCLAGAGCVQCTADAQCAVGQVCTANQCVPGCSILKPACAAGLVCDTKKATCVGCVDSSQCVTAGQPVCDPATQQCVGCLSSASCSPVAPNCDPATHTCVHCVANNQCAAGSVCVNQACVPGCTATQPCAAGSVCGPGGTCVQCVNDAQCSGATPRCSIANNTCVACLPGASDNCAPGQYCRADFVCERGCKTGADCPSGVCLADHSCGGCTLDAHCSAAKVCQGGSCIAACSNSNPCGAGQVCCGTHCQSYLTDNNNCGGCGIVCGGGSSCCGGSCQALDTLANCGGCGIHCGANQGCCTGACQNINTQTSCGACGRACGADQFCDGLACHNVVFPEFCANTKVYAIQDGQTLDNAATNVLASTIVTNCSSQTTLQTGPQTNPAWIDQTTGALLLGSGSTVVTAGGPFPNLPVKWLERTRQVTKVYFATNGIDTFYFRKRSDSSNVVTRPSAMCSSHNDVFLVELVKDPVSGTLALIAYGLCSGGYGTQTGAWYWANQILPNRNQYPNSWYIFEWTDTNADSAPNAGDTFTQLASGQ